jgi:hypothetical protein
VSRDGGRGRYKKDSNWRDEKTEEKQSCDKDFSKGKGRGAGGENCMCSAFILFIDFIDFERSWG